MPEEVDRAQIAPERVEHHNHVHPEQLLMGDPRELHHQEENQQTHDEVLPGVGALAIDRDLLVFHEKMVEGVYTYAQVDHDKDMIRDRRQPLVDITVFVHVQDLQHQGRSAQGRPRVQLGPPKPV